MVEDANIDAGTTPLAVSMKLITLLPRPRQTKKGKQKEERRRKLVKEYHDLATVENLPRAFTGNLESISVMISVGKTKQIEELISGVSSLGFSMS